jgi:hypothetical protein
MTALATWLTCVLHLTPVQQVASPYPFMCIQPAAWLAEERESPEPDESAESLRLPGPWFVELGASSHFSYLHDSHRMVDRWLTGPFGRLPGYTPPRDFHHLRRSAMLFTGDIALGRRLNDWADLAAEAGLGSTELDSTSEPLLLRIRTQISYTRFNARASFRLYPLGRPIMSPADGLEVLAGTRPFVYQAFGLSGVTGTARVPIGLRALPPVATVRLHRDDWIPVYTLGGGIEVPLGRRTSLLTYGYYSFFFDRREEFNGFSAAVALRVAL